MNPKCVFVAVLLVMFACALAAQQYPAQAAPPSNSSAAKKPTVTPKNEGERVFEQHCSRCHTAPDSFSQNISGTVARHMRVRASLSQREEVELLHFLNP